MSNSITKGNPAPSFNEQALSWREDFPLLQRTVHGDKRLVYLDNAATSQKPQSVIGAIDEYYRLHNSNVHRALHQLAGEATAAYEGARAKVADFVGAASESQVVFTRGTTEGINLVAAGWGRKHLQAGDEVLVSEMEHHSNLIPWQRVTAERGAVLRHIPVDDDGVLDLAAYRDLLNSKVKLVSITHMSNLLGTINPIQRMVAEAHACGAVVFVDAAQSVPHLPVDMAQLDCDFLAFSGHKMLGPTGIGALVAKPERLEEMDPYMSGGEMILKVTWQSATWADIPHRFEAGTPNIAGAVGFGAALDYLQGCGLDRLRAHEQALTSYALGKLASLPGLTIYGNAQERGGAISFDMKGIHPHDVAQFVDQDGVAIRAGHMCVQPLIKKYGLSSLNRASLYLYNTEEDIDQLVLSLHRTQEFFDHGNG